MSYKLVLPTHIEPLIRNSFEALSRDLSEKVIEDSERIFGNSSERVKVVGTFKNYIIVVNENAKFAKVFYESSEDEIFITGFEILQVPVFENSADLVSQAAPLAVDALISGSRDTYTGLIRDLIRTSDRGRSDIDQSKMTERISKLGPIYKLLDESAKLGLQAYSNTYDAKYVKNEYNLDYMNQAAWKDVILTDLGNLIEKLEEMDKGLDGLIAILSKVSENDNASAEASANKGLLGFMKTFKTDVIETQAILSTSIGEVTSAVALGSLYDLTAERVLKSQHIFNQLSNAVSAIPA